MAGEIQLNSTTMATESSGSITAELDTIRPNTTNGSLTLQGDSSNAGVTGLTIDSSGVVNTTTAKVTNIQATSGQSLTIKDEDGNTAITVGTDNTAASYLSLNFGSNYGGTGSESTLDDYEFGSWTPIMGGQNQPTCYYCKVGRLVMLQGDITLDTDTTTTAVMTGLPFNATSSTYGTVSVGYVSNNRSAVAGYVYPATDRIDFSTPKATASLQAGDNIFFTAHFITD